jgi:hexokinase
MEVGLKTDAQSNMAMLPSFIFKHPTGQETGEYLGLEVSGKG